jgi:hypothetical protein
MGCTGRQIYDGFLWHPSMSLNWKLNVCIALNSILTTGFPFERLARTFIIIWIGLRICMEKRKAFWWIEVSERAKCFMKMVIWGSNNKIFDINIKDTLSRWGWLSTNSIPPRYYYYITNWEMDSWARNLKREPSSSCSLLFSSLWASQ